VGERLELTERERAVAILSPLPEASTSLRRLVVSGRAGAPVLPWGPAELGPPQGEVSTRLSEALLEKKSVFIERYVTLSRLFGARETRAPEALVELSLSLCFNRLGRGGTVRVAAESFGEQNPSSWTPPQPSTTCVPSAARSTAALIGRRRALRARRRHPHRGRCSFARSPEPRTRAPSRLGQLYAALERGRIDAEALRTLVVRHLLAGGQPPIYAVDVSVWPRCDAETSPERGFYYHPSRHSAGQPIVAGWA
jgi:hypothetical protein